MLPAHIPLSYLFCVTEYTVYVCIVHVLTPWCSPWLRAHQGFRLGTSPLSLKNYL